MLGLHGHQLVTEVAKIRERYTIDVIRGMLIRLRLWPRSFAIPLDEAIHRTPKNRRLRFQLWSKLLADCVDHLHRLIYISGSCQGRNEAPEGSRSPRSDTELPAALRVRVTLLEMVGFFATSSFVKLTYNFQAQQEFLGQGLTSDSFFCKVYLASSISSAELQYRQHNLRPGFTEMFVVGAAQNGLQDVDSGLDTVHVTGSKHLVQRLSTLGLGQGSQAEPCHRRSQSFESLCGRDNDSLVALLNDCRALEEKCAHARKPTVLSMAHVLRAATRFEVVFIQLTGDDNLVQALTEHILPKASDWVFPVADVLRQTLKRASISNHSAPQHLLATSTHSEATLLRKYWGSDADTFWASGGQTLVVTDRSDGWQLLVVYRWSNAHPTATAETAMIAILTHVPS
ncbi:nuclear import and export protein Msn5, partial [Aureobasidium melanogenum]